ncbi:MAG: hypothetical protein PF636_10120 [Actinomycetota bacterium]|nr:hypothetical protein [Actinomycetota bacterium]
MKTYTSEKRVERNGRLVAYAGETMLEDEAKRRGLISEKATDKSQKKAPSKG